MMDLADAARNKWPSLLPALGISQSFLTGKHGPCPICGGSDRFRFDDKDGRGTWFCNACRAGDGISLLQKKHGWTFKEAADQIRPLLGEVVETKRRQRRERDPLEACQDLWRSARPLTPADQAFRYLQARGVSGAGLADLRFHPECRVSKVEGRLTLPAMLALVRAPNGSGASIHRTYLEGAAKANIDSPRRMMPGPVVRGSAIRLGRCGDVLGIAEGIETALRVRRDFGMPCWAACNSTMLREFEWPSGLRELHVFGDNDQKFAGQAAAYQLGYRAMTAPRPVQAFIHIPPTPGHDWLDHGLTVSADAAE